MGGLTKLQQRLEKLQAPTLAELEELLLDLPCPPSSLLAYVTEPDRLPYGRNVLFRSSEVEAVLVHLPARARTFIHDHGGSFGCARVLEGEMLNVLYSSEGYGYVKQTEEQKLSPHDLLISQPKQIHCMVNPTDRRTVSLHVYAPPLFRTKTYRLAEEYVLDFVI